MFRSETELVLLRKPNGEVPTTRPNRFNTFRGTVGYINDVERNTISTDPEQTIKMVHSRVSSTFYTAKSNEDPPVLPNAGNTPDMSHHPPGIRKTWSRRRRSSKYFDTVLAPLTGADLRKTPNTMGKNKAPGPSGITVEMLRHLPDVALDNWLLPFVNHKAHRCHVPRPTQCATPLLHLGCAHHPRNIQPHILRCHIQTPTIQHGTAPNHISRYNNPGHAMYSHNR